MKAAVVTYPGSNCDRDLARGFELAGFRVESVWHKDRDLPEGTDVVGIPGGFSWGDYLRCGAIAARAEISDAIRAHAARGGYVLGVCNGFQVLTEMGLLPGALLRNANLKYVCKVVDLKIENGDSPFTSAGAAGDLLRIPVAHHDGNFTADAATLSRLNGEGLVAFRYVDNPNGSAEDIAGILSKNRRVLGMMPHPERRCEPAHGGSEGSVVFRSLLGSAALA